MLNNDVYKYTLRKCNTYCFSTATMVVRTHLSDALYVPCQVCIVLKLSLSLSLSLYIYIYIYIYIYVYKFILNVLNFPLYRV